MLYIKSYIKDGTIEKYRQATEKYDAKVSVLISFFDLSNFSAVSFSALAVVLVYLARIEE